MALHLLWIIVLTGAITLGIERFGFNPTDQGFVVAQSWRVLHGEIPHLDIISARPLGSAYLHVLDLLLPGPLFLISIAVATLQMIILTVVLASWTSDYPLRQWGLLRTSMVVAAVFLNIHLFPINAWHTIDGIFLVVCGWWALDIGLRTDRTLLYRFGLFALGFASITKQSFVPAVAVGLVVLLVHPASKKRPRFRRLGIDIVVLLAAPLAYLLVVTAAGGFGDMLSQLTGGVAATGRRIFDPGFSSSFVIAIAVFVSAIVFIIVLPQRVPARWSRWLSVLPASVAVATVLLVVFHGRLERAGVWGIALFWMLAACVLVDALSHRTIPWRPLGLLLLAWMASLSWGYDSPTLLAGSMVLLTLDLVKRNLLLPTVSEQNLWIRRGGALAAAVTVTVVVAGFVTVEQAQNPYRDRPRDELVADLGTAIPEMRGIESNASTFAYIQQIRQCIEAYPAEDVAILPDNAFVYPALHLHNPFPLDWMLPIELIGDSRERIRAEADRMQENGQYLVLFATVGPEQLASASEVPAVVAPTAPIVDPSGVLSDIRSRLKGRAVSCGSFVGVWAPKAESPARP
ncbi:hypothetical protein [Rhodococcus sp. H29-C3]|uniref:hypothetical protein n=1 Tax=Rhodococcus sp. H29-C3 TaxID=3046307 RepID=UPI0024BA00A4|nr:hypothetical protein [Rhodococcus sp. H29-C3]MDJ0359730.1 hypothetical protein [Rhodococcus sp. H29-C3]